MSTDETVTDGRLPGNIVPTHYELELIPDLDEARFSGSVVIDLEVSGSGEELSEIICNAADLEITEVRLTTAGRSESTTFTLDADAERLRIATGSPIGAGPATLSISFTGILNDMLRGFYRSTYTDGDGTHVIATTQFQSTDARRTFPCWDEPDYKATFSATLVVDPDLLAVSNTGVESESLDDDGRRRVRFARTIPMSTYLVAFVVGPLEATEPTEVHGVPVRVVHRPGQAHLTAFAIDVARHAIEYFEGYYDIPYPSDKLDLIAVPDFAFGAMENLGCVTFREVLLLVDPERASQPELQRVADVINHEIAHMWFGDLVTMKWWEGIWLNEAFATFMETACSDAYRPDWDVWTTFGRARAAALDIDSLRSTRPIEYPVITPDDAEGMFDTLTYEKGAAVVRMLEQYLGAAPFRDGVRHYLRTHAYDNTETRDLWSALEHVTGEPVGAIMESWIYQGGYPLVSVEERPEGVRLTQAQFTLDPSVADDRLWNTPIRLRTNLDGVAATHRVLLDSPMLTNANLGRVITANADGVGFYRVERNAADLASLSSDHIDDLTAPERHGFIDDAWALTRSGRLDASSYTLIAEKFASDADLTVWQALSVGLSGLTHLVDDIAEPILRSRIADTVRLRAAALGTEPGLDDSDRKRELRATVIRLMGGVGNDPATIAECRQLLDHRDTTISAAALFVTASHGDADDFARVHAAWLGADDPQSEQRNLRSLADFPDAELVMSILAETLDGRVRSQDGPYLIRRALTNRHAGVATWSFVTENWQKINELFPSNSISRMLEGVVALDHSGTASEVAEFLEYNPIPQGEIQVAQHLESLRINVAARERETGRFSKWIAS